MFCPKCNCEYRDGFKICVDCGSNLVKELPINKIDENNKIDYEYKELVTIATTNDRMIVSLIKSILNSVEIRYFIKGEFSRFFNSMEIQVFEQDVVNAKELLKELDM